MNPSFYKSVSMRKNAWDTVASLAEKILPYGKISKSQVVEIAINRLNHQLFKGEVLGDFLDTYNKQPKKLHLVKKLPEPEYVGTAITRDEIYSRNRVIYHSRVLADRKLTLQQLGTMYNITRERVRQIQAFQTHVHKQQEVSTKKLNQQPKEKHASNN